LKFPFVNHPNLEFAHPYPCDVLIQRSDWVWSWILRALSERTSGRSAPNCRGTDTRERHIPPLRRRQSQTEPLQRDGNMQAEPNDPSNQRKLPSSSATRSVVVVRTSNPFTFFCFFACHLKNAHICFIHEHTQHICNRIAKKYSCMYTTDLKKQRKVWHDGKERLVFFFDRIAGVALLKLLFAIQGSFGCAMSVNSKVYLISEEGHTLAESFMKLPASRAHPESSPDRLNYLKVHPEFCLDEDEEIVFDPVEDSQLRPSSYAARIVNLVRTESENVPLLPSLNTKARQDLHKRKMEYLDQTIKQFSKRPKPAPSPQTSHLSDPSVPSTPIPSSSRPKISGFERPFNSPLMHRSSKQSEAIHKPVVLKRPPPSRLTKIRPSVVPPPQSDTSEPQLEKDPHHVPGSQPNFKDPVSKHDSFSSPSVQPRPRTDPPLHSKTTPRHVEQSKCQADDPSKPRHHHPSSASSSSSRVSSQKTLKVDWDSFFLAAKPP
ncbi:hypothetical protein VP01_3110g2, partial [Puccinia sorghi]